MPAIFAAKPKNPIGAPFKHGKKSLFRFDLEQALIILGPHLATNQIIKDAMNDYAVIQTGGKQYLVHPGEVIKIELLPASAGQEIEMKPVLAMSAGEKLTIGRPNIENASVKAVVMQNERGPKVISFKMKRRKGYHRKKGHRQELTVLRIMSINS